jgi:hypothetical protein
VGIALDSLLVEIEARYEGYPDGLPPDVYAQYKVEAADYTRRARRFDAQVIAYKARYAALKRADSEVRALVNQYNASR